MKQRLMIFIIGFVLGILVLPICGYIFIWMGRMPVATAGPPLPFEAWVATTSLKSTITRQAPREAAFPATETNLIAGAKIYRENCAVCHGLLGQSETSIAMGMYPPVPQFFAGDSVSDDPVGETYWKVAHGIRLTGMPGYKDSLSEMQIWQVSHLLANYGHLPPPAVQILKTELPK